MQDPVKQHHITTQSIHDLDHLIANPPQVYDYDETARLWKSARDWRDLCHLQTLYVQGVLPFNPTYSGALSCESSTIVGYLQSFNQHGFLTTVSQPACASTALNAHFQQTGISQRAFVSGWMQQDLVQKVTKVLMNLQLQDQLKVCIYTPVPRCDWIDGDVCTRCTAAALSGHDRIAESRQSHLYAHCMHAFSEDCGTPVTVAEHDNQRCLWAAGGDDVMAKQFNAFAGSCNRQAMTAFAKACYVTIIDLKWGRDDTVWPALVSAVT
mgnify:CR=1 FL=1